MSNAPDDRLKQNPTTSAPRPPAPEDEEELVHYDDRVIGRAFRWSLVAMLVLARSQVHRYYGDGGDPIRS
jgi:hypothetical protein